MHTKHGVNKFYRSSDSKLENMKLKVNRAKNFLVHIAAQAYNLLTVRATMKQAKPGHE
jgi:hypothetical protein